MMNQAQAEASSKWEAAKANRRNMIADSYAGRPWSKEAREAEAAAFDAAHVALKQAEQV